MNVTIYEVEKLLTEEQKFGQIGFSMLLERLKASYAEDSSPEKLKNYTDEINAFLNKFKVIMNTDFAVIENISKSQKLAGTNHLLSFEEASKLISTGELLHIAGSESLLKKLPKGNWVGGSTEYFITEDGGKVSGELLFITKFPYKEFAVKSYDVASIAGIADDAYSNGFSIVIIPFDSDVHIEYAEKATSYNNIFMRSIVGWIAGTNLNVPGQSPMTVNGITAETHEDKAVALHLEIPENQTVGVNIINIFEADKNSQVFEFTEEGFVTKTCLVDGEEENLADYIAENSLNTKLPLVGDYSGNGVNISFKSIENGIVNFYAPVFKGIKYRIAKEMPDYAQAFQSRIGNESENQAIFSCNCILNYLYGELEGKKLGRFIGPVTFGEIAYQLVNQTLVYITVTDTSK